MESISLNSIGLIGFLFVLTMFGCKDDEPLMEEPPAIEDAEVVAEGMFQSASKATSGVAKIESNGIATSLVFKDFETGSGPDVIVYLSLDNTLTDVLVVGDLKSTRGDFSYSLPADVDYMSYNHVLVWCEDFSVLFGSAELVEQ